MSTSKMSSSQPQVSNISGSARDAANRVATSAAEATRGAAQHYVAEPAKDLISLMRDYARENPDVAAVWCFGVGVLVGWKLKP